MNKRFVLVLVSILLVVGIVFAAQEIDTLIDSSLQEENIPLPETLADTPVEPSEPEELPSEEQILAALLSPEGYDDLNNKPQSFSEAITLVAQQFQPTSLYD